MNLVKKLLALGVLLFLAVPGQAQDYKFHSYFFHNFAKYTQWPTEYRSGDFVIGILGDSKIRQPLEQLAREKQIRSQKIVVKEYSSIDDIGWCHILFIPFDRSTDLQGVLGKVQGQPTLVVTEKPGLGRQGSGINFVLVNGRWQFELNRSAVENAKLKVSSELSRLAIQI
ncbi:MAG TPA: DUF4154 domain-containing protein [Cytophagales bacterium]|nr:DUF4154 domain-containing protein [Cytophagales bacterium]HAA21495.1 DUF4154 domain-containing protein [Cytophagales bacterium]HAP64628.1 DUF4154 domain-containing protein [Cytophagales bacterium]